MPKLDTSVIGKRYGELTVLEFDKTEKKHSYFWCKCDCGNIVSKNIDNVKRGLSQSCGCTRYKRMAEKLKKQNTFTVVGDEAIGVATNTGAKFRIDAEDIGKIKHLCWFESQYGYIMACVGKSKNIFLHRFLLRPPKELVIDHINHDRKDNRKKNLRVCTQAENACNQKGEKGLYFNKQRKIWQAYAKKNGKHIYLGCSHDREEALQKRIKWELENYKEFSQYYKREFYELAPLTDKKGE